MKTMDSLIAERDDAENRADYAESLLVECQAESATLAAGLRLVRSVPVLLNDERHGYDCAGCGAPMPIGEHREDCVWQRAMQVLRDRAKSENGSV